MRTLASRVARRLARLGRPASAASVPMGRGSYGSPAVLFADSGAALSIGNFCSIASNVTIFLGGEHRPDWVTTYPFNVLWEQARSYPGHPRSRGDVTIEHDVWIGYGATILSGVTLHTGSVVGARALVARDVPAYTIVAGNPAREIRKRFDPGTIECLLATRWWEWSDARIERVLPKLLSCDVAGFLREARGE